MGNSMRVGCLVVLLAVSGCAHIDFGADGMTYYDPAPYLFVSTTKECVTTATVVVIPGARKSMKFVPGYGSSNLTATLSNGMITSVGQQTDANVAATIGSIASLATAAAALKSAPEGLRAGGCAATAILYPVVSGSPDKNNPIPFEVSK